MMDSAKRCVLFYFLFGQLIAGVNREREHSTFVQNLLTILETNAPSSKNRELNGVLISASKNSKDFPTPTDLRDEIYLRISNLSTLGPLCSPFDSCNSRCGEVSRGFFHSCNCDSDCTIYSDCCVDFIRECTKESTVQKHDYQTNMTSNINATCEMMFDSYPVLLVSTCSYLYKSTYISKLCGTKLPRECFLPSFLTEKDNGNSTSSCESFVYALCAKQLNAKCNRTLEERCAKIITKECTKISLKKCKVCDKSFWPVTDPNGILYKNSYCATCNFQNNYTFSNFQSYVSEIQSEMWNSSANQQINFRNCFPSTIDFCKRNDDLSILCKSTSGPVTLTRNYQYRDVVYKNIYCALCNNEGIEDLQCASPWLNSSKEANLMQGVIKPLIEDFVTGITADIQGLRLDDIPAAFSMLLNFGLDGRQRVYISSEGDEAMKQHQKNCGSGKIWDPFSSICRKLHCSTEFVLVDYHCVRKEGHEEDYSMNDTNSLLLPDTEADFVHLSFVAEMELFDFLQFSTLDIEVICESIRESFSTSFNINIDRIRNVNFNISATGHPTFKELKKFISIMDESHSINFTISMDLYENSVNRTEPSVDSIVSLLASALSVNGFELGINNATSRIYEIHQTAEFLTSWCDRKDGGEKKEYWNSDFKLILNEEALYNDSEKIKGIYINKTGKFYPKGEFVADILYQGYQFNQNLINVSGVAIVCDWKKKLNDSCPRLILENNEYSFAEDGSLLILNTSLRGITVDNKVYEISENGSVMVCLTSEMSINLDEDYGMKMDVAQGYVTYVLSWISVSSMVIVLITYSLFSSLRNLPGCNTMNLTFSLMAMQITFSLGQRNTVTGIACKVVASILHFELLACFMWMNVMAYDLYKTFGNKTMLNNIRSTCKYLPRYMAYAYGIPLLFIVITSLLDHFLDNSIFSPHYGRNNVCWITSKHAAAAFFALPLAIIMCINFGLFMCTIYSIRNVKHVLYLADEKSKQRGKSEVFLYARMALVIGLTWGLSFAAAYSKVDSLTGKILTYLFTIFNTLQGVFIFCVFVCNRRVYGLYRDSLQKLLKRISKSSATSKMSGTFPRLANAMHRTISSDTVISIVSNSSTCSNDSGLHTIKEIE